LGPIGLIGGIPLSIVQALKTIHHFGLCYGYSPDTETEKLFSYAVLAAATAHTSGDKKAAVDNLRQIHQGIYRQATDDLLKDTEVTEITGKTKEAILGWPSAIWAKPPQSMAYPLEHILALRHAIVYERHQHRGATSYQLRDAENHVLI
jgi:hypothetical protein